MGTSGIATTPPFRHYNFGYAPNVVPWNLSSELERELILGMNQTAESADRNMATVGAGLRGLCGSSEMQTAMSAAIFAADTTLSSLRELLTRAGHGNTLMGRYDAARILPIPSRTWPRNIAHNALQRFGIEQLPVECAHSPEEWLEQAAQANTILLEYLQKYAEKDPTRLRREFVVPYHYADVVPVALRACEKTLRYSA